jgi:hypothetical protein
MMDVLAFTVVLASIVATGTTAARWLYRRFETVRPEALELLVAGAVFGIGLWIAASWILALTHTLTRPSLLTLAALFTIAALLTFPRARPAVSPAAVVAAIPIAIWTAFILWRGTVVPPVNHDALSYHLPKAVLFMRAAGFPRFENFDHRFPSFPANYELLVADQLLLLGSDRILEWIGTAFFLLFLLATALLAQHWWGHGAHIALAVLAVASAPVVLLHSGADKNDLMTQFFALTALLWGARWAVRGGVVPMAVLITSMALAVGTKTNAGAIAIGLLPFLAWQVVRGGVRVKPSVAAVLYGAIAFILCGGAVFLLAVTSNALMGVQVGGHTVGTPLYVYRFWSQLWQIPLELFTRGLSGSDDTRHILFSSHFGPLPAVLLALLPFAVWRYRESGGRTIRRERTITSMAALLAFLVMLPTNIHPPAAPRYALFLLPLIIVWTIAPAARELLAGGRLRRYAAALAVLLVAVFAQQAIDAALHDASAPLKFARWCARNPGTREVPRLHEHASMVTDRLAGANDTIALYGDVSSWIYPLFGAGLTRPLIMLPEDATPSAIPPAADWVVIERWWKGGRAPAPLLHEELRRSPEFRLVFHDRTFNQSVFRRARP